VATEASVWRLLLAGVIIESRRKGCWHFPYVEAPEAFFPAVAQFLAGTWPEAAVDSSA
jgi:hypothetical protein